MPLPDERPRQSVANLIGRFEKQKSSTASHPPPPISFARTSSVTSQRTDDSGVEEIKEKREWPPKNVDSKLGSLPVQTLKKPTFPSSLRPPANKERPTNLENSSSAAVPAASSSLPQNDTSESTITKAKSSLPDGSAFVDVSSPPSQTKPPLARTNAPPPVTEGTPEAPHKPQIPGGSTSSRTATSRSQHANQPTTSTYTPNRSAGKARASAPPRTSAVTSPARPRTPSSTPRVTSPSVSPRSKTPLASTHSKISSGLYAPTAASLARSKAGVPAPPAPEKPKRKLTTDLSKPTAASASKIRSPATVPSPKPGKPATVKPAATKITAKTTASKAPTPVKRPTATKPRSSEIVAVGTREDGRNSNLGEHTITGSVRVTTTAAISQAEAGESDETLTEVCDTSTLVVIHASEKELENADPATHTDEDIAVAEEILEPEVQQLGSQDDEEIESYDEDFGDDTPQETLEDHDDGHAVTVDVNGGHLGEESSEIHVAEQTGSAHSESLREGHHDAEETAQNVSQSPLPEGAVDHGLGESLPQGEVRGPKLCSDQEEIVSSLKSGPEDQTSSTEPSSTGGTVSEAGEIPDEC